MLFLVVLILALLLQSTVTTIPLILVALITTTVIKRSVDVFFLAFLFGLFFDILTLQRIGGTSLFFLSVLLVIFLYQRKFEITSLFFILFVTLFSSYGYCKIFGINNAILHTLASVLVAGVLFVVFQKLHKVPQA